MAVSTNTPASPPGLTFALLSFALLLLAACAAPTAIPTENPGEQAAGDSGTGGAKAHPIDVAIEHEGTSVAAATPGGLPGTRMLLGLSGSEIVTLLGPPGFRRRDAPAEIWQYGADTCVLDLFLYRDADDRDTYRVRHAAIRGDSVVKAHEQACLAILFGKSPG